MYPGFTDYVPPSNLNQNITFITPDGNSTPTSFNVTNPSQFTGTTPGGPSSTHINYTPYTGEFMRLLNVQEKKEIEIPRELYVNIKMLEVIEKVYTFEKMTEDDYLNKVDNILKKIEKLKGILQQKNPNFTIDMFIQEYGLSECTFAIQRIKKGKAQDHNTGESVGYLIAGVTARFIKIADHMVLNEDTATVNEVLPMLEEMRQLLNKLKPNFHSQSNPFNLADNYTPVIVKLSQKQLSDVLSKDLVKEILDVNEFVKKRFELFLSK
jgi:VPS28 protein.